MINRWQIEVIGEVPEMEIFSWWQGSIIIRMLSVILQEAELCKDTEP